MSETIGFVIGRTVFRASLWSGALWLLWFLTTTAPGLALLAHLE